MTTDAIIEEIHGLERAEQRELLVALTRDLDGDTVQEIGNLIETRRRAKEMKSGSVKGVTHEETFTKARAALG
jgi:hypothetical protein